MLGLGSFATGSGYWAFTSTGLFVTEDPVAGWTHFPLPPGVVEKSVLSAEATGSTDAWLVTFAGLDATPASSPIPNSAGQETAAYDLWHTTDAGSTWTRSSLGSALDLEGSSPPYGSASVNVGATGPASVSVAAWQNSNASFGTLFSPAGGGTGWVATALPHFGPVVFTSSSDGWLLGGPAATHLDATTDGGATWVPASISLPPGVDPSTDLVTYQISQVAGGSPRLAAFASIPSASGTAASSSLTFYALGTTGWSRTGAIDLPDGASTAPPSVAVGDGTLVVSAAAAPTAGVELVTDAGVAATSIAFADAADGLGVFASQSCAGAKACTSGDHVMATSDGGATWVDVTP